MTSNLIITSLSPGVGKTTFTFALALKFKQEGKNVGYFKPISDTEVDTDAKDAKELLEMQEEESIICPSLVSTYEYDMTDEQKESVKQSILDAYKKLNANYDILLIESCRMVHRLVYLGLSTKELAQMLDAKVLILTSGEEVEDADRLILTTDYLKEAGISVLGGILTLVPQELFELFKTTICPKLTEQFNIKTFGLVPDRTSLVAPTVKEIKEVLNAKVLAGKKYMNKLVENYMVGAMEPESALKYFRRSINKAVITGGDRPQLALAAMETDTSVLVLTGSLHPPAMVLARAEEAKIPVLLVVGDTYSTVKRLTHTPVYGKIHADQKEKLDSWDKIFETVDYKAILSALGQ
ncbi:MAG: DRTGG domain-containing protein [Candidatus Kariarchaeaceae archaeon]|jgi:BioD-like phosphotransacetylase family protein